MLKFPARQRKKPTIHLTALIDIVFLLLIFFLLASSFVEQVAVNIVVPEVESENSGLISEIIVEIDLDGNIWFEKTRLSTSQLTTALSYRMKSLAKYTVVIQADRRAQYDTVMQVIDSAKLAGAKNFFLVARQKND